MADKPARMMQTASSAPACIAYSSVSDGLAQGPVPEILTGPSRMFKGFAPPARPVAKNHYCSRSKDMEEVQCSAGGVSRTRSSASKASAGIGWWK
jgi:hypothetical protein